MKTRENSLYLIDGNALCYRAFYAIQDLSTSKGFPTNAIYGFINMLKKIIKEYEPGMMTVVFDMPGPTERHEKYEEYKIQREPMPDALADQMDRIKDVVRAYNIPVAQLEGYEADDIIATIAEKAVKKGIKVTIVSSDKDALQLIDGNIRVLSPHPSGDKLYERDEVVEKYGVGPEAMTEMMALMGDSSDNVPGVKGVGKVTAAKLIKEYGTVDGIYKNLDKLSSESLKKKLTEGEEMAFLSRELVELNKKVPFKVSFAGMKRIEPDKESLSELYREFEFTRLLKEISAAAPKPAAKTEYSAEEDPSKVEKILKDIYSAKRTAFVFDAEEGSDIAVTLSWKEGKGCYIPLKDNKVKEGIKKLFADKKVLKAGFDIKEEMRTDSFLGSESVRNIFDVMVADYLDDPSRPKHDLEGMALRRLDHTFSAGSKRGWDDKGQATMDLSGGPDVEGECEKCDIICRLYDDIEPALEEKHLTKLLRDVEMPLVGILADMENEGVGVDVSYLKKRSGALQKELDQLSDDIYKLAGEKFNINSPKQLQVILYEKLGLPALKKTKTGISTDESVLVRLADMHDLPKKLLQYRELNKLKTGYYDSIQELVDPTDGKLHARFNQAVTATGRLSSSEPNLQNIPIKTPLGRKIRKAFLPGEKGNILLGADYSQVELRILAHLSGDEQLIKAFAKEEDVHKYTASLIFDCKIPEVTDEMRSVAKTVNFGIIYGMSAFGLAKDLGIRIDEAHSFIDAYFKRYKGVKKFIENTVSGARKKGYVKTILNRRRYIPEINSPNEHIKNFAERAAVNTPVQGSAADLIKLAMIKCADDMADSKAKMIIQVHDELVFKVPEKEADTYAKKIKKIMEEVIELKVPLKVDVEAGPNWYDMEELEL